MKNVFNSKEFWKTMRPFLSDKNTIFLQISTEKNNQIIYLMTLICLKSLALFLKFFEDAVRSLNVKPDEYYLSDR